MSADSTRSVVAVGLTMGLILILLVLALKGSDGRLTFMLAGGLLSALSAIVTFLFR